MIRLSDRKFVWLDDLIKEADNISCQSNRYGAYELIRKLPVHGAGAYRPAQPSGLIGIHWYSQTNEWMDCLVIVQEKDKNKAMEAISAGLDCFWEDDCDIPYGDCIGRAMNERMILYAIEYFDEEVERYEQYWEGHLSNLQSLGIKIVTVTS